MTTSGRRHPLVVVAAVLCVGLVVAGIGAAAFRPIAPPVSDVPAPGTWFDAALLERIAAYRRPLYVVVPVAVLVGALGPLVIVTRRRVRAALGAYTPTGTDGGANEPSVPVALRAAGVAVAVIVLQDVLLLPARWWIGFAHAGDFGLRTQGLGGWVVDRLVTDATGWVGVAIVAAVIAWQVRRLPSGWPPVVALTLSLLAAATVVAWPLLVEPLRHDFAALPQGPVRTAVERVTGEAGLGGAPILVADASRRTTRRNAYVSGWGATRRIVLYDTLLAVDADEVTAVVAHEVAHALHEDLVRGWLTGAAAIVVLTGAAGLWFASPRTPAAHRVVTDPRVVATVVAVGLLVQALVAPVSSWLSRRAEASADATALEITAAPEAFADLQRSLVEANLSDPSPPDWWVWWRMTHPPAAERIHRAETFGS